MNQGDAQPFGGANASDLHNPSIDKNLSTIRRLNAGQHFHQRALPCSVLADDRKHLSGLKGETDVVQGANAGKAFAKLTGFQNWRGGAVHSVTAK
jgi:hypothetical protein